MEQRLDPRFELEQRALVSILGDRDVQMPGRLENISGNGARLTLPGPVTLGAAVRVDLDDTLLLGEVCYCMKVEDHYCVGLQLDQALSEVRSLVALMRNVMGEAPVSLQEGQRPYTLVNRSDEHGEEHKEKR